MTATVKIDLSSPAAIKFLEYVETLPFAEIKKSKNELQTHSVNNMAVDCEYPDYTVEDMRQRVLQAEADIAAGRFMPIADIPRKTI